MQDEPTRVDEPEREEGRSSGASERSGHSLPSEQIDLSDLEASTRLDAQVTAHTPSALSVDPTPVPTHLGRYMIIEELGRGGMGVVLRAYDPRLQREVALKKLAVKTLDPSATGDAQARIVREARAMAKLNHPNVVAVYDVEAQEGDDVVLAMELVEGRPLSRWLRSDPPWPQIVAVFVEAGRGLAAAHAAGLMHRDFKPANVIVRDDGRALVTDFGLARTPTASLSQGSDDQFDPDGSSLSRGASIDTALTMDGTVVGTPPYMAPECHLGQALDPTVDQYAFCVSLWRALTGVMPFHGARVEELAVKKLQGPPPWPGDRRIPAPIVAAITRGLAPTPSDRWPSMEPLLEALEHRPARRDRVVALAVVGAMAIGAAAALTASVTGTTTEPCTGGPQALAGVWNDGVRSSVLATLSSIDRPYAPRVAQWVQGSLDRRADAWLSGHRDACEATTIRGEQSEAALDLRMACLMQSRQELGAVLGVLTSADASVLDRAEELVGGMTGVERCADVAALQAEVPPPEDPLVADAVEHLRERLSEVKALRRGARFDEAEQQLAQLEQDARTIDYPPLRVELLLMRGKVDDTEGRYDEAEAALREALRVALRVGQWRQAWEASNGLVMVVGDHQARYDTALAYHDTARGLVERIGQGGVEEATLRTNHGQLLLSLGQPVPAETEQRAALALFEQLHGEDHPDLARVRTHLALCLQAQGRYDEATAELTEAKRIWEAAFSPDYPEAANTLVDLGLVHKAQGRLQEAEATFRTVIEIWERTLGPEHPRLAGPVQSLSNALRSQGKLDEAEAAARRGIALSSAAHGPTHINTALGRATLSLVLKARGDDEAAETELRAALEATEATLGSAHPRVLRMRGNLANILKNLRRLEDAEAQMRTVLAGERAAFGAEHPRVADTLHNLANIISLAERPQQAAPLFEQAVAMREKLLGPQHRSVAMSLTGLGYCLLEDDRNEDAVAALQKAWAILEAIESTTLERARVGFPLARALWETGADKDEALRMARQAHADYVETRGAEHATTLDAARWIEEHE